METKFKTNIKCAACIEKVTPELNDTVGQENWSVDLGSPDRILSVKGEVDQEQLKSALTKVGYKAEPV